YTYAGDLARYEAGECSLVYLGCQQQAAIVKADGRRQTGDGSPTAADGPLHTRVDGRTPAGLPTTDYRLPSPEGGTNMEQEKALARIRELEGEVQRLTGELAAAKAEDGET